MNKLRMGRPKTYTNYQTMRGKFQASTRPKTTSYQGKVREQSGDNGSKFVNDMVHRGHGEPIVPKQEQSQENDQRYELEVLSHFDIDIGANFLPPVPEEGGNGQNLNACSFKMSR